MKKSVPIKNLKPEPSMSDKAKAVFAKKSKSKPATNSKVSKAKAELDKIDTYRADAAAYRSKGSGNKIGPASARHLKQIVTGNEAQYLLDKRMEAAQHSRPDSERYDKAYKATKDYAAKRRSKK